MRTLRQFNPYTSFNVIRFTNLQPDIRKKQEKAIKLEVDSVGEGDGPRAFLLHLRIQYAFPALCTAVRVKPFVSPSHP